MNYMTIKYPDVANGTGCRLSLFVSGCTHRCKGCFNPESWDFQAGKHYTKETRDEILEKLSPTYIDGITFLGGEPLELSHQREIADLILRIKKKYPDKTVWIYTGYHWEILLLFKEKSKYLKTILDNTDVLVDGPFIQEKKDIRLKFRGSSNQRIIDVRETLKENKIILKMT